MSSRANRNRSEDLLMASASSEVRKGRYYEAAGTESSWKDLAS